MLDSGFCVLRELLYLKKKGVYGAALIKKRWYRLRYIDDNKIKSHFNDKDDVAMDALRGDLDNVPLRVFAMKEEDCATILMSTYGTLNWSIHGPQGDVEIMFLPFCWLCRR